MKQKIVTEGIKVDFHIHSIGSRFKDHSKVNNLTIDNIDILIKKLNDNNINMCAITDHDNFEFKLYKRLKEEEGKGSIKKVLPGVEFSVLFENEVIHIIVIFDDANKDTLSELQSKLVGSDGVPNYDNKEKMAYSEKKFLELIKEIGLSNVMIAHQKGSLSSQKGARKNDVLSLGMDKFEELVFVDYFDSFEFKDRKNEIFNKNYLAKNKQKFNKNDIRFITGSDCHDWNNYPGEDNFIFTYLKCLPTFRGLSMAVTNYTRIKFVNSFFSGSSKFIDNIELKIDDDIKKIQLSKGINVIIGDNSIGKSLLIHKLTNYAYLNTDKRNMKKNYEEYLKNNNIEINTKIKKNQIYEFDKQGGIREKFEKQKLTGTDFLNKHFPVSPNVSCEKQIVLDEITKFINFLKLKKEYNDCIDKLNTFNLYIRESNSNSLTFNLVDIDYSSKVKKCKNLIDNYNFIIEKIKLILQETSILDIEDIEYINGIKDEFEKLLKKYTNIKQKIEYEVLKVNSINDSIRVEDSKIQNIKTDEDKKFEVFKNAKNSLIETIAQIVKFKELIKDYKPNIEKKELNISENVIGKYRFITKTYISEISNEYIIEKIKQPLQKKYRGNDFDINKIEINKLDEYLLEDIQDNREKIVYYEEIMKFNIEEDFKVKNTIIDKEEKDKTKEMSAGFNSKIYFEILSYQDKTEGIYIIDQPEDDVSPTSIKKYLLEDFKEMCMHRQIILITHNPQFIVNLDVDNIIFYIKMKVKLI